MTFNTPMSLAEQFADIMFTLNTRDGLNPTPEDWPYWKEWFLHIEPVAT